VGEQGSLAIQDGYVASTEAATSLPTAVHKQIKSQMLQTVLVMMADTITCE
jgi:hypothetical protein